MNLGKKGKEWREKKRQIPMAAQKRHGLPRSLYPPTPFWRIYAEYEGIGATPGLTDTALLY